MPKVLPAAGFQHPALSGLADNGNPCAACDLANAAHWNSGNFRGHSASRWSGEQQFVVVAAVKSKFQTHRLTMFADNRAWNRLFPNLSSHATLFADVIQISRETVADIDHGRDEVFFSQKSSLRNSWLGKEMFSKLL